jgi:hypothetical protein
LKRVHFRGRGSSGVEYVLSTLQVLGSIPNVKKRKKQNKEKAHFCLFQVWPDCYTVNI